MVRALALTVLCLFTPYAAYGQGTSVLHIRVTLVDAAQQQIPVSHHALLISVNPTSAVPRIGLGPVMQIPNPAIMRHQ